MLDFFSQWMIKTFSAKRRYLKHRYFLYIVIKWQKKNDDLNPVWSVKRIWSFVKQFGFLLKPLLSKTHFTLFLPTVSHCILVALDVPRRKAPLTLAYQFYPGSCHVCNSFLTRHALNTCVFGPLGCPTLRRTRSRANSEYRLPNICTFLL